MEERNKMDIDRRNELICPICGKIKQKSQFNLNPIPSKNEYLYFCKTCTNAKLKEYLELLGNEGAALWCLCMELGVPFMNEPWTATYDDILAKNGSRNIFLYYLEKLGEMETKPTGLYDSDMMLSDFFSTSHIMTTDLRKQRAMDWGHYTDDEYDFLEAKMDEYTGQFNSMKPSQINRYRDLCKAELRKRKLEEDPDVQSKDISSVSKEIMELMKLLKIDDFQSDTMSDIDKHIERKIWMIENTKPAECEDLEKYRDISGFDKAYKHIMRCMQNLIAGTREYPDVPKDEK